MLNQPFLKIIIIKLFIVFLILNNAYKDISSDVLGTDAGESLAITLNLASHHFFALNDSENKGVLYATNQREPLPIFLWAQSLNFFSNTDDIKDIHSVVSSGQLVKAKCTNLIFLALLLISILLLVNQIPSQTANTLEKGLFIVLLLMALNWYGFFQRVNLISNDVHTSAWLCLLMLQFVYYFKKPSAIKLVWIGIVYGLLCLTKATFFYSGMIVFILAIVYQIFHKMRIKSSVVVLLAALIVTAPWLVRNYVQTGQTAISGRGPETFVDRTYEEIYNDAHFIGLWYAYSPDFLKPLATKLTGYSFQDRLKGGRLQHSTRAHVIDHEARKLKNEAMAINSHFKAGIWMNHIYDDIYAKVKDPVLAKKQANNIYKQYAFKEMFAHPIRHLKFTAMFAWRGIWILNAIDGRTAHEMGDAKQEPLLKQILPFLGFISLLGLTVYGIKSKHNLILMCSVFSVAAYGFNSFFSHNLPRYGDAFLPIWLLAFGLVLLMIKQKMLLRIDKTNSTTQYALENK